MAGTRSSARQAAQASSSPNSSQGKAAANSGASGSKRKAEVGAASKSKRGKKGNAKEQKTIEETMPDKEEEEAAKDVDMKDAASSEKPAEEAVEKTDNGATEDAQKNLKDREDAVATREEAVKEKAEASKEEKVAEDEDGTSAADDKPNGEEGSKHEDASMMDDTGKVEPEDNAKSGTEAATTEGGAVQESSERDDSTPSSILEKGIIYFFFRGRVGIDEPSEVGDLARSYIVLRPLPHGAKLGEGAIGDAGNYRLLALPKKVLPKSPRDRFMIFVEKANTTMDDIKNNHLTSSDYETKTAGTRHTPAATPVAEGVYAITTTGRESHLAYILTIPAELSEVQEDVGLRERGSFVASVKNPQYSGPAGANLPQGPEYPKEILNEFRSLRWMPLQPKHLDYAHAQFILIGEGSDDLAKATAPQPTDEKSDKDTPLEELEKLEHEDEIRVEHLKGDDSVFEDLGLSSKEYPKVMTTW